MCHSTRRLYWTPLSSQGALRSASHSGPRWIARRLAASLPGHQSDGDPSSSPSIAPTASTVASVAAAACGAGGAAAAVGAGAASSSVAASGASSSASSLRRSHGSVYGGLYCIRTSVSQ
eukprot:scaffold27316_cov63-Phaeocystis_antarctica.AAC.3